MCVNVKLTGTLVARAGAHQARVAVDDGATVKDVVDGLADRYGDHVRPALLAGDRLRSDTRAVRESPRLERLYGDDPVEPGDTVRFEFASR